MKRTLLGLLVSLLFVLGTQPVFAEVTTRTITYDHSGTTLKGYLARPGNTEGQRPGVMVVHQWMGLGDYEKKRARQLAELGYVAFAADIYGADTRPTTTHEASLAASTFRKDRNLYRHRLQRSLEKMRDLESVEPTNVAAMGYCFGGTGVLELARSGADVEAVVSFHGGLANPNPKDAGNIKATVQVHHGAEDPHVTRDDVRSFWNEMNNHAEVDWTLNVYSDAPHGFTEHGTDAYDERADELSWRAMKRLFGETLSD